MKCELCNFEERPDNIPKLATHLETCSGDEGHKATLVWRSGQLTATLEPKEDDHVFDVKVRYIPPAPEPDIVVPVTLNDEIPVEVRSIKND